MPLFIHGDGLHTRRYLYAGDAADAFDTILHKGQIGEVYNVDSRDEVSNFDLATKLLDMSGISETDSWIKWTRDRPFNDRRYAVDGTKLRKLGWKQQVSFEVGLAATVDWYARFSGWWGKVENTLLAPFPVVKGGHVVDPEASRMIETEAVAGAKGNGAAIQTKDHLGESGPVIHQADLKARAKLQGFGNLEGSSKKRKNEEHQVFAEVDHEARLDFKDPGDADGISKKRKIGSMA